MTWHQVDRASLLRASGADPYVELAVPPEAVAVTGEHGWAVMHPWRPSGHWGGAAVVATDAPRGAESEALATLLSAAPGTALEWFSTLAGRDLTVPAGCTISGAGRWDFLSISEGPPSTPLPEGLGLVELDDTRDAAELQAFGSAHNAEFEGFPGRGYSVLWLGARDRDGALTAIGGMHVLASGAPHLSGIVVDRAHRGSGLGRALTIELTRRAIERAGFSTLGVFSANAPALGLYHSLGYTTQHSFHTRVIVPA